MKFYHFLHLPPLKFCIHYIIAQYTNDQAAELGHETCLGVREAGNTLQLRFFCIEPTFSMPLGCVRTCDAPIQVEVSRRQPKPPRFSFYLLFRKPNCSFASKMSGKSGRQNSWKSLIRPNRESSFSSLRGS